MALVPELSGEMVAVVAFVMRAPDSSLINSIYAPANGAGCVESFPTTPGREKGKPPPQHNLPVFNQIMGCFTGYEYMGLDIYGVAVVQEKGAGIAL